MEENLKKPPVSFKPPFPSSFLFFTNEWYTVLINHDFKTSFGLILNDLFTCWKFGFIFNPRLKWPSVSCTWAYPLWIFGFLWRTDKTIFAESNKPHPAPINWTNHRLASKTYISSHTYWLYLFKIHVRWNRTLWLCTAYRFKDIKTFTNKSAKSTFELIHLT